MPYYKKDKRKFLIDEALPPKNRLPKMRKRYDLKHIFHDFGKKGLEDEKIQMFAQREKRTIITADKFFVKRFTKQTSVLKLVGINLMTSEEIDQRLIKATDLYKNSLEYEGKIITATAKWVNEKTTNYKIKKRKCN